MTGLGRDPPVERLAELTDHHEIVDRAGLERAEALLPGRGQRLPRAERLGNQGPRVGCVDHVAVRRGAIMIEKTEILRREGSHHAQ